MISPYSPFFASTDFVSGSRLDETVDVLNSPAAPRLKGAPFEVLKVGLTSKVRVGAAKVDNLKVVGTNSNITFEEGDGTYQLYLECVLNDAGVATEAKLLKSITGLPASTSDRACFPVGRVVLESGMIKRIDQELLFNVRFFACGRDISNPEARPGTYHVVVPSGIPSTPFAGG